MELIRSIEKPSADAEANEELTIFLCYCLMNDKTQHLLRTSDCFRIFGLFMPSVVFTSNTRKIGVKRL